MCPTVLSSPSRRATFLGPIVFTALVSVVPLPAQLPPQPATTALQRAVDKAHVVATEIRKETHVPGLSVAVATHGRVVFAEGFGDADLEQGVPVTPLTKFRIGSLSKLLTAAAVAKLVELQDLDLDQPVRSYVPYFPEKRWPILVRQLCSHTGGIRHYGPNDGIDAPKYFPTVRDGIGIFKDDPLVFEPGTDYRYSSYAFNLLSAAVERASGTDFLHYVHESVCEPLGLHSTVADDRFKIVAHRTRFYHRLDEGVIVHAPAVDNSYKWASGGFLSTATDLARFGLAHTEPGYFEKETLALIFTPQPRTKQRSFEVGLAWRVSEDDGRRYFHHGGAIAGGRAFLLVYPETRTTVAILANMFVGIGREHADRLLAPFFEEE